MSGLKPEKRDYHEMLDLKLTSRCCNLDGCEFGCKHDFNTLLRRIESKHNCVYGNVQHQSKKYRCRRYQCISHVNCPIYVRINFSKDKHVLFSEISDGNHSTEEQTRNTGIHWKWLKIVDDLALTDLAPSKIHQHLLYLSTTDPEMEEFANQIPSRKQIHHRKHYIKTSAGADDSPRIADKAIALINKFNLLPHPEGGYFKETYRSDYSTAIYFLVTDQSVSRLHKIKSDELWHFYKGIPYIYTNFVLFEMIN